MAEDDAYVVHARVAADIAQELFYALIESTWTQDMLSVNVIRNRHYGLTGVEAIAGKGVEDAGSKAGSKATNCGRTGGGWLIDFPSQAFEQEDEDAKHALLADGHSIWAFVVMHAAVRGLFRDLVEDPDTDIKELVHYINARTIVQHLGAFGLARRERDAVHLYPDSSAKGVYEITLRSGVKIALDLAGAQYKSSNGAKHETILRWDEYWNRWGFAIKYRVPFRYHHITHTESMSDYRVLTPLTIMFELNIWFNLALTHCEKKVLTLLRDSQDISTIELINRKRDIINTIKFFVQQRSKQLNNPLTSRSISGRTKLHHPAHIRTPLQTQATLKFNHPPIYLFNFGSASDFDWRELVSVLQDPGTSAIDKRRAAQLLKTRLMYTTPEDWKMNFVCEPMPGKAWLGNNVKWNPWYGKG